MQAFEKAMSAAGPPPATAPDLPDKLPGHDSTRKWAGDRDSDVPSLKELGYHEAPQTPFKVVLACTSTSLEVGPAGHVMQPMDGCTKLRPVPQHAGLSNRIKE